MVLQNLIYNYNLRTKAIPYLKVIPIEEGISLYTKKYNLITIRFVWKNSYNIHVITVITKQLREAEW